MKKLLFIIFYGFCFSYSLGSEGNKSFLSTYEPENSGDFFIENTRILTGTGEEIIKGSILISENNFKNFLCHMDDHHGRKYFIIDMLYIIRSTVENLEITKKKTAFHRYGSPIQCLKIGTLVSGTGFGISNLSH